MSNKLAIQKRHELANVDPDVKAINRAFDILLYGLSDTSKRQYEHTINAWLSFCQQRNLSFADMNAENLIPFLEAAGLSRSTRQNRLSHMRKLLQTLMATYPDNSQIKSMFEQSKLLKIKTSAEERQNERAKNTLKPKQVYEAFDVWGGKSKLHARNRALLAVLLYGGLRRSEAVALKWSDIDFENETILVRHGKGDKERTVPFLGSVGDYLQEWLAISGDRDFVFCGFRRGDHLAKDAPMKDQRVYEVLLETGKALGIDFLSPHDMRRTLLQTALAAGASVADMQFIAGHSNPETTLGYAQVKDAKEVQGRVKTKLPY
jgi:integrase